MPTKNEKPLAKTTPIEPTGLLPGAVCAHYKRCGKPSCRCAAAGGKALHGPYWYRCFRVNGQQVRRYVRPDDLPQMRAACAAWQQIQARLRENRRQNALGFRIMSRYLRELERGEG